MATESPTGNDMKLAREPAEDLELDAAAADQVVGGEEATTPAAPQYRGRYQLQLGSAQDLIAP